MIGCAASELLSPIASALALISLGYLLSQKYFGLHFHMINTPTCYSLSCLRSTWLLDPKDQPLMTTKSSLRDPLHRLATLRRHASTKARPLGYKPAATSPKKQPTVPTGFAAIGSYKTIARRYELSHRHPSSLMPYRWTALMVGIPFVVVTSYILYQRGMSLRPRLVSAC